MDRGEESGGTYWGSQVLIWKGNIWTQSAWLVINALYFNSLKISTNTILNIFKSHVDQKRRIASNIYHRCLALRLLPAS